MSRLHDDLLEQARHLANREHRRPKQASLRRAISTAYYALFHLLLDEATRMLSSDPSLRQLIGRAFLHDEMKQASIAFKSGGLPPHVHAICGVPVPAELQRVAEVFVELQEARHESDYKLDRTFTRRNAIYFVDRSEQAFQLWESIRTEPIARVYLASLLLWRRWR
jgi:uncharacterized protein (UPF0332 family)